MQFFFLTFLFLIPLFHILTHSLALTVLLSIFLCVVLILSSYAWFTFSSQVLVETFSEMWTRQSTHECRHFHSCAKTTRQSWNILISFDSGLIYRHVTRASRRDENTLRVWKMRRMDPSHSHSLVSCCLNENVNQPLLLISDLGPLSICDYWDSCVRRIFVFS